MTPKEVIALAQEKGAKVLDLRFIDFPGLWQNTSYPITELTEECFEEGFGFDGSSIRGWQAINESDMLLMPDAKTAFMDPFRDVPTLCLICSIYDPITREHYTRDPRGVAQKAISQPPCHGVGVTGVLQPNVVPEKRQPRRRRQPHLGVQLPGLLHPPTEVLGKRSVKEHEALAHPEPVLDATKRENIDPAPPRDVGRRRIERHCRIGEPRSVHVQFEPMAPR